MARPGGVLVFLIALALAQSLAIGLARVGVERAARSVAIVVDGNDARALAAESGRSLAQVLRRFRLNGATGVATYDETIPQLVRRGRVVVTPAQWAEGLEQSEGARAGASFRSIPDRRCRRKRYERRPPHHQRQPRGRPGRARGLCRAGAGTAKT